VEPAPNEAAKGPEGIDLRSVVGKMDVILGSFTIDDDQISLAELVRRTGLPKTTLHRICQVLTTGAFLERVDGQYRLGLRLFELGQRVPRQRILRDAARPHMQRLLYQTKSVTHLVILDGLDALVIERLSPFTLPTRHTQIAGRMPLHCTAAGKALLAFSPPALAVEVMREGLQRRTPRTITSALHFTRALERARATGIASEVEEMHVGYLAVGAPILSPEGTAIAALSVTAPVHNWKVEQLSTIVREAATVVSGALHGSLS
jgi:DNA-binding IclR family transcriptional regulator